eukprot:757051-Hanusia_phi.AAC.1
MDILAGTIVSTMTEKVNQTILVQVLFLPPLALSLKLLRERQRCFSSAVRPQERITLRGRVRVKHLLHVNDRDVSHDPTHMSACLSAPSKAHNLPLESRGRTSKCLSWLATSNETL